jgi:hypothetical protein
MMTVKQFLEQFFRMRESFSSAKSATGGQLERARLGTEHLQGEFSIEDRYERFAFMVRIWSVLSPLEQAVLFALYNPLPASNGQSSAIEVYTREVLRDEVSRGEDIAEDNGETVTVKKTKPAYRTHAQVAELLGLTLSRVRNLVRTALNRIILHDMFGAL